MGAPASRFERLARGVLVAALVAQLAVLLACGRFPHTDETFYKAAGREWAASGRFAAPELAGFTRTDPSLEQVFFAYPPLYPFLFGLAVKLFGFSWRTCVGYDALVHVALVLVTAWLARRRLPDAPEATALVAALLVVPLGTSGRPDELAMACALVGLGLVAGATTPSLARVALSGLALGLAAGTSPGVAGLLGAQGLVLLVTTAHPPRTRTRLRHAVVWGACTCATFAAVIAPVLLATPEAYRQAFGQAVLAERLGGFTLRLIDWRAAWPQVAFVVALLALGLGARATRVLPLRAWARTWLVAALALSAVVVLLPGKHTYLWMWGPWLLIAALECVWRAWCAGRRGLAATLSFVLLAAGALAALPGLHRALLIATLPADQTLDASAARLRALIPHGSVVLVDELWWSLAADYEVKDAAWWRPVDPSRASWVVLSGNGTGAPGRARTLPSHLAADVDAHFEVVRDDLNPRPASLLGLRLSRSGYGFGVRVLRRRHGPTARQ